MARHWYCLLGSAAFFAAMHVARAQSAPAPGEASTTARVATAPVIRDPATTDPSAQPSPTMADPATAASVDKSLAHTQLPSPRPHDLIVNWPIDLGITFVAGAVWISTAIWSRK